jgi:pseudouridine synthase
MPLMRLQKFLSAAGVCSRRHGEAYIQAGRVRVNGRLATILGTHVDPDKDRIEFDGRVVSLQSKDIYIALHKPKGYVTSCSHAGEAVVVDLIDLPQRLYPVGRLDKDSTGLLLLTNDGRIHHRLSHPSFDHEKEYEVTVERPIPDSMLERLSAGIPLKGVKTRPAKIHRLSGRRFRMVLMEGRNRQIRRMVQKLGYKVVRLKRIRVACIRLGNLPAGAWRHLSPKEQKSLLKSLERSGDSE